MQVTNKHVLEWVKQVEELTKPKEVVFIDGSEAQLQALREEAMATGELIKLNEELLPGCYLHRSNPNDVARVEDRTFICTDTFEATGPINNWMKSDEAYAMLNKIYDGCMKDRTMYVIPYVMGPVGSPFSRIGFEITDSIYVVVSMAIMAFIGEDVINMLGDSDYFVKGIHAKADVDPEKRYICHFPDDNTIMSINSAYGGNALLGKKCFALRIASTHRVRRRAGSLNICSSSVSKIHRVKQSTSQLHSHLLAARQTLLCLFHLKFTLRKAIRYGA